MCSMGSLAAEALQKLDEHSEEKKDLGHCPKIQGRQGRVVDKFSIAPRYVDHARLLFDLFFHN